MSEMTESELRARVAQLEREIGHVQRKHKCSECHSTLAWKFNGGNPAWFVTDSPESPGPGTQEAIAAERAKWVASAQARVGALPRLTWDGTTHPTELTLLRSDILAAIAGGE